MQIENYGIMPGILGIFYKFWSFSRFMRNFFAFFGSVFGELDGRIGHNRA